MFCLVTFHLFIKWNKVVLKKRKEKKRRGKKEEEKDICKPCGLPFYEEEYNLLIVAEF